MLQSRSIERWKTTVTCEVWNRRAAAGKGSYQSLRGPDRDIQN
jgi:hypothetical protein